MRFLMTSAAKDLRRRLADWPGLAIWLGIPLFIGTLMTLAFGGDNATPKAHVLLADEDASLVGGFLGGASSGGGADYLDIERVSTEEGRRRMDEGEASALVILPQGLTDAMLNDTPATITLVTNPAQRILPEIVRVGLDMFVEAVFYLQRILGEPLRAFFGSRPQGQDVFADASVATLATSINQQLRLLESIVLPPVLSLETASGESRSAPGGIDFATLLLPSVLFMSLLFIGRGFSDDLWVERRQGTLRRAVIAPHDAAWFLGGKLAAGAIFMAAVSLAGLLITIPAASVPLWRVPGALVWCTFSGTALISLFLVLQFLASTARGANIVTTMVLFPMMMIGGSFFPFEMMPGWMAAIGRLTPNGQGVTQLKALLLGPVDVTSLTAATAAIGLPAVALFFISARLVRGRFAAGV